MIGSWLGWQIDYLLVLQNFRDISGHIFDEFFLSITMFGEMIIPFVVICLIYWCINKKSGMYILWNYMLAVLTYLTIKMSACIYRPWVLNSSVHPLAKAVPFAGGYSFPSGHTADAVATWGGIAVKFWNNKIARYICIFLIFAVMFSRNYVGVHTPQDVIVSFLVGLILLALTHRLMIWEEGGTFIKGKYSQDIKKDVNWDKSVWDRYTKTDNNRKNYRDLIIAGILTMAVVLFILYVNLKSYPMDFVNGKRLFDPSRAIRFSVSICGAIIGVFYGWIIEKRFINFDILNTNIKKRILRYIMGIIGLFALLHFGDTLIVNIMDKTVGKFILYMLLGLYITAIYPYIFKKLKF